MWSNLSLRTRLGLLLCSLLSLALGIIVVLQLIFASVTLEQERGLADRVADQLVRSLSATLDVSDNPEMVLAQFLRASRENKTGIVGFEAAGQQSQKVGMTPFPPTNVPAWFIQLLGDQHDPTRLAVSRNGKKLGDLIYFSDMSADLTEKWITFVALIVVVALLICLTFISVYFALGSMLKPLVSIKQALTQLRAGSYDLEIECRGSPDLVHSCREVNQLAGSLMSLHTERSNLLRQMVTVQDAERSGIAKELHDELGPILFAIRAHATSISDGFSSIDGSRGSAPSQLLHAVEILQQANRRILDRLQPLYLQEFGIASSIQNILSGPGPKAAAIAISSDIDPQISQVEKVTAETIYRVVQEGVTNVLRHSRATKLNVLAKMIDADNEPLWRARVLIEIADNGKGAPPQFVFGRGLRGMNERLRALGGSLSITSGPEGTCLSCLVPALARNDAVSN